ncbi:MAG TPA: CbiX/SirB N-terminal domain-containing protein [Streptosporangiaceae bacterium]|nr:CbiX/SirB N-terminal domain-containing protein [Streptosporangiaceae bacterium]
MSGPVLIAVAHGTRDPAGPATVRALLDRVRALRPWLPVAEAYAEISAPPLDEVLADTPGPAVVVPLILARGYHAQTDIPERAARRGGRGGRRVPGAETVTARPLGPHALLAAALADRLGPARHADAVVLGAAGSARPTGVIDARVAARLLSRRLRRPVPYGFVAAGAPALPDVVADLRRRGARRVAVASYLLAPGYFHERMLRSGADEVSPPVGAHHAVAGLILRRFDEASIRARALAG